MGSCMAHLNCLPPRAAGVNDWFFLLAHPQFRFVYVYTIAINAPAAALRLMAASGDRSNGTLPTSKPSPAMIRIDRNSANRKFMPTRSSKTSRKTSFCCYERRRDWRHCAPFTFLLLCSHSKNNFSTTLTPTEKPRYTYCRDFFVDSIYSKTIDIIRKKKYFFLF